MLATVCHEHAYSFFVDIEDAEQETEQIKSISQLIADSEARATEHWANLTRELRDSLAIMVNRWDKVEKERDLLRAEVESLRRIADAIEKAGKEQGVRAEREVEQIRQAGFKVVDNLAQALARAERAEAELAAERARLDWTQSPAGQAHMRWNNYEPLSREEIDRQLSLDDSKEQIKGTKTKTNI